MASFTVGLSRDLDPDGLNTDLYVVNSDGSNKIRLTSRQAGGLIGQPTGRGLRFRRDGTGTGRCTL